MNRELFPPVLQISDIFLLCFFVCFYPKNVKTTEQTGHSFCFGHSYDPSKDLQMVKVKNIFSEKMSTFLNIYCLDRIDCFCLLLLLFTNKGYY